MPAKQRVLDPATCSPRQLACPARTAAARAAPAPARTRYPPSSRPSGPRHDRGVLDPAPPTGRGHPRGQGSEAPAATVWPSAGPSTERRRPRPRSTYWGASDESRPTAAGAILPPRINNHRELGCRPLYPAVIGRSARCPKDVAPTAREPGVNEHRQLHTAGGTDLTVFEPFPRWWEDSAVV